ncbi:glycine C-acetyltransferase [Oceanispirochaeta crateris]|uniref:2-amino-3-ketobutyrate coenzyme A ligase n=1 Tax=Oceanispirochaeta crateris TaxID=2518645 RepID=A0A5C1QNL3_9SPIO|nr:glycine C-acetyltransferase [Oceanispirochaeta crateris]QEN08809.1 glycine C-acetyltransferase [Oceanispirochaeta crateris]
MSKKMMDHLSAELKALKNDGLYKSERIITSPQAARITVRGNGEVLNFCANNYLGLADSPALIEAAQTSLKEYGFGLSSVRFICGTQNIHKELEATLSDFLGMEDSILYSSCFDANGGLFEAILGPHDAVISDELNHASIIDGIRLCKAQRYRYKNNDMKDLELKLVETKGARFRLIATDGVFSMDGTLAKLKEICTLAESYDALVMVDDSHAVGFMGETGAGTPEYWGVKDKIDIITGTLGKALGGASGGYTSGRKEIISWLRQRSRPYLFSNSLAPVMTSTALKTLELLKTGNELRDKLFSQTRIFRQSLSEAGFSIVEGVHPIVPLMLGDASLAERMADRLLSKGIYAIGFSYPVVPMGKARIRFQMSAAHSMEDVRLAVEKIIETGRELGVIQ